MCGGGGCIPACNGQGCVYSSMQLGGVYHSPEMAAEVGGTHPSGIHSCL